MRENVVRVKCDRCFEPIADRPENATGETKRNDHQGAVFIDAKALGLGEIIFQDLDENCRSEVAALIRTIIARPAAAIAPAAACAEIPATPRPTTEDSRCETRRPWRRCPTRTTRSPRPSAIVRRRRRKRKRSTSSRALRVLGPAVIFRDDGRAFY
jgi:hypothetical protein